MQLEANKNYNFSISVSSCDATSNNKFVKLYIDYNQNGVFTDANELIATSNAIASNGIFSGSFTVPNSISPNNFTLLRVVLQETNDATTITPCNTYASGETQDYRVEFIAPITDVALLAVTNPAQQVAASNNQFVSVRIKNVGTATITNGITLTAVVRKGAALVGNLSGTYSPSLAAGASAVFTFQIPVATDAASNYTINATATTTSDQISTNNTLTASFTTLPKNSTANGTAVICGPSALLKATNTTSGNNYFWYNNNTATTPIAAGTNTTSTIIVPTYFLGNGANTTIGLANKNVFASGGGYQANGGNYFNFTATVPVRLDNARVYTSFPGKITILVADITGINGDGTYRYIVLDSVTIDAQASRPTQVSGNVSVNDPADLGMIYNLGLTLPTGTHALIAKTDGVANIFRNNNVTGNPYPFNVPGVLSINSNNATSTGDPNFFQGLYYYLYNMSISTLDV
ncbi:MAG: GEVED domain-containing protein, partial [Dolichospermum sp.]